MAQSQAFTCSRCLPQLGPGRFLCFRWHRGVASTRQTRRPVLFSLAFACLADLRTRADKTPHYTMPLFPALMLLIAAGLHDHTTLRHLTGRPAGLAYRAVWAVISITLEAWRFGQPTHMGRAFRLRFWRRPSQAQPVYSVCCPYAIHRQSIGVVFDRREHPIRNHSDVGRYAKT